LLLCKNLIIFLYIYISLRGKLFLLYTNPAGLFLLYTNPAGLFLFFFVSPSESIGRLAAPSLPCRAGRTGQPLFRLIVGRGFERGRSSPSAQLPFSAAPLQRSSPSKIKLQMEKRKKWNGIRFVYLYCLH
jgi:hypothetical protein